MSWSMRIAFGLVILVIAVFVFGLVPTRISGSLRGLEDQRQRAAKEGVGSSPAAQQWAEFAEFQKETKRLEAERESLAVRKARGQ